MLSTTPVHDTGSTTRKHQQDDGGPRPRSAQEADAGAEAARLRAVAAYAAGDRRFITVVTADSPVGKMAAADRGAIKFTTLGNVVEGAATIVYVPTPQTLLAVLAGLNSCQYVIPDIVGELVGTPFRITTAAKHREAFGDVDGRPRRNKAGTPYVALTSAEGLWELGAWRVLDRDVDPATPERFRAPYAEWLETVDELLPGAASCPRVYWPSSKTRVALAGKEPPSTLNCHTWIDCSAGGFELTNQMRDRLRVRASELGMQWAVPRHSTKTGEPLPGKGVTKTPFDLAVWTIHRLFYSGPPSVGPGLVLLPPAGVATDGAAIDLNVAVPLLDSQRVRAYAKREKVIAELTIDGRVATTDSTTMRIDHEIDVQGHGVMTVGEFLRDGKIAFDTKHRCQAMYRASSSWNGIARKYETGIVLHHDNGTGITYVLRPPDVDFIVEQYVAAEDKEAAKERLAASLAAFRDADYAFARARLAMDLGIALGVLDKLRKARTAGAEAAAEAYARERIKEEMAAAAAADRWEPRDIATLKDGREILRELTHNWAVALTSTATVAATFRREPAGHGAFGTVLRFMQYGIPALKEFVAPFPIVISTPEGKEVRICPVTTWATSEDRTGVTGFTFEPGLPRLIGGSTMNLWTGLATKPLDSPERCRLILQHIREVIAAGDDELATYITKWLAMRFQGIAHRKEGETLRRLVAAIILRGAPGTGKGIFEHYLAAIVGPSHCLLTSRGHGLSSRFNSEFANLILLCADEAFFAGSKTEMNALKSFQSEAVFSFEAKFRDCVSLPNHCAVIMSSNESWVAPADAGQRRWLVTDVSPKYKGNQAYFAQLLNEMHNGGPAAFLGYLLKVDITDFNPEKFPGTDATHDQQVRTIGRDSAVFDFLYEALETGGFAVPEDKTVPSQEAPAGYGTTLKRTDPRPEESQTHPLLWREATWVAWPEVPFKIERRRLGQAVRDLAIETRKFAPPSNELVGRDLARMLGGRGSQKTYNASGDRVNAWLLPGLAAARARLANFMRTGTDQPILVATPDSPDED
jgi:hypothetical protein